MYTLTDEQERQLAEEGYVLLPGLLSKEEVASVLDHLEALWIKEGKQAGVENYNALEPGVRRLANLANKGDLFRAIFAHALVIAAAVTVMGPRVRLSMLNAREVPSQQQVGRQAFHADTDNSGKPDEQGYFSCTAIWMLDPFTPENGATRIVPGTHISGLVPREVLPDVYAAHPQEVVLSGQPGDVAVFNGHCWHAGGSNQTDRPRRAILAHYLRSDIPRPNDRRQHLSPQNRANMTPRELELLGLDEKQYAVRMKYAAGNFLRSLKTRLPV